MYDVIQVSNYYFSDSIHSRFFLEEDAVDLDGKLNRPKQKAVNKIGHGTLLVL